MKKSLVLLVHTQKLSAIAATQSHECPTQLVRASFWNSKTKKKRSENELYTVSLFEQSLRTMLLC
jgi:hypothetical protein